MERYDYQYEVINDVRTVIDEEYEELINDWMKGDIDRDDVEDTLYNELINHDSVTGNASGSYFCNRWKAEEAICHNLYLLCDVLDEYGMGTNMIKMGAERCDVQIRCYLLCQAIKEVLDKLEDEFEL